MLQILSAVLRVPEAQISVCFLVHASIECTVVLSDIMKTLLVVKSMARFGESISKNLLQVVKADNDQFDIMFKTGTA